MPLPRGVILRARSDQHDREAKNYYGRENPAKEAAEAAVICKRAGCGHRNDRHDVLDGVCEQSGCKCEGFKRFDGPISNS